MKIDMELKPGDVVLLKVLACVLILFFMARFLIFPGMEKHQELVAKKDDLTIEKQEMQYTISSKASTEKEIATQKENLEKAQEGFYDLMENREVDSLITGLALKHDLFPVYLNIEDPVAGVPAAYQLSEASDDSSEDSSTEESQSTLPYVQYVNTTTVTITLQGQEAQIRELLDDIAKNYPGIQVRSFDMQSGIYVDSSLQKTEQMNCNCVLAVYTCGELSNTKGE
ncbi:hypothetical protein [Coprococcus comes]|uniref:hypothetical protein n=1 Tax=Coprococcus comes TaxID=410072 RepID=UPI0015715773|nr:hypothetical protein [Coprococcus comes]NSG33278.1 hypothetical protein [Coprococcus comes]